MNRFLAMFFTVMVGVSAEPVCEHCASESETEELVDLVQGEWIAEEDRKVLFSAEASFEDHEGQKIQLAEAGMPLVISFIYTRCENERKCPRMTAHLGGLGKKISTSELHEKAGVVLLTYDPQFDQPEILARYGEKKDFLVDDSATCRPARCTNENFKEFFKEWELTVNFDRRNEVSLHGNQILVLDRLGRLARRYEILLPSHEQLLEDLEVLKSEDLGEAD